ncbi:MAG: metallophosphoesterase family protein [Pseudomonadales bacterium]
MVTSLPAAADTLTFAQLSDPHLSSLTDVRWWQLANKRLLGYLSWSKRRRDIHDGKVLAALQQDLDHTRPNHIVVTGDLTHIAMPDEFKQARLWLESLGAATDVSVIPGNHDAYLNSGWRHGWPQWQAFMASDTASNSLFPSLRVRGPIAFIGLSSACASAPLCATGTLGAHQLARFEQFLQETGKAGLFRVVLIHHPPIPGSEKWRKRLTDGEEFCALVAKHGAELVLHGHRHRASQNSIATTFGPASVFGIPSSSSNGNKSNELAQYYLYTVQRLEQHWQLDIAVQEYNRATRGFAHVRDIQIEVPRHAAVNVTESSQ